MNESLIHKWKRDALKNGVNGASDAELKEALILRKRIKELETENEVLKKAAIIFGRGS